MTIAGKPAVNAVITVVEIDLEPDADEIGVPEEILIFITVATAKPKRSRLVKSKEA